MRVTRCYRFVTSEMKSKSGDVSWAVGEWVKHMGPLVLCEQGLHACRDPLDSLSYIYGDRWYMAELRGSVKEESDKLCASEMRLVKEIPMSVIQRFAVDCAERYLANFEREHPKDKCPREAIEAARAFIENPTEENRRRAGSAAWSARSAAESARSAAWSAERKWQSKHLKQLIKGALK